MESMKMQKSLPASTIWQFTTIAKRGCFAERAALHNSNSQVNLPHVEWADDSIPVVSVAFYRGGVPTATFSHEGKEQACEFH